ncbi:MAG TPA: M36 family metallopeptidase [Candidatus Limnocylindria bacterium]|nr:M36 family metallopeptidase [Candidatus Limnocylindria bacterium]
MRRPARASRLSLLVALVFVLSAFPGQVGAAPGGSASATSSRFVTGPSASSPTQIALDHIRGHARALGLRAGDTDDIGVVRRYTDAHNGVTHVYLAQRYRGIEVIDAYANYNIARNGSIISFNHSFVRGLKDQVRSGSDRLSAAAAVKSVARQLGLRPPATLKVKSTEGGASGKVVFARNGISLEVITARLVYQRSGSVLRLSWQIDLYEPSGAHWWNLRADASRGTILARSDYVSHADDAYNVFALPKESPNDGGRTIEVNPANGSSPNGWHNTDNDAARETTNTTGNNVNAYADRNADNVPDTGSSPDGTLAGDNLTFNFPLDLTDPPEDYQDAAVTNLFYWNNIIHDVLYNYGFDEKSGNFQLHNFGAPGKGGDPVRAEAQDGSGRNNANFLTPPDGFAPRMQMFEWRDSAPNPLVVEGIGTFSGPMAGFGSSLATTGPISGQLVIANDGVAPTSDGCTPFAANSLVGKIPLIDRGTCTFVVKVKNAQNAGAATAVVANNVAGPAVGMGGADPTITIPSIMISLADATTIKAGTLPANATLSPNPNLLPDRDSDLDNGVIAHEYGHGVSNRLTGGNVGCLQNVEQMGEGWSDLLALMLTAQSGDTGPQARGIGTYVVFQPGTGAGIRPTPYSTNMTTNPATYQMVIDTNGVTLSIPHGVGYVWASMVWEVYWNLVDEYGFNPDIYDSWDTGGNNLALQLMIDGMKFQPCNPGFVSGRNAILEADLALTGGENQCLIWEGFAKRGLGFSAEQRSSKKTADGTAAFDLPPECQNGALIVPIGMPATLGQTSGHVRSARRRRLAGARRSR